MDLLGRPREPALLVRDDRGSRESTAEREPGPDQHPSFAVNGGTRLSAESRMLQEWHYFFENTHPPAQSAPQDDRDAKEDHGFRHGRHPRSMVDRYAADMQDQRAFEAKRRRGDMY